MAENHWLMPPDKFKELDDEFHFNFDPCPCPKPDGYDSTQIEWGTSNFVNNPDWKSSFVVTCKILLVDGEEGLIIQDNTGA